MNPAQYGLLTVTASDGRNLPYGRLEDVLSRDSAALNCHTNDDKNSWFAIDLGLFVIPSCYTLRHARGYGRSALRNWNFQVSFILVIIKSDRGSANDNYCLEMRFFSSICLKENRCLILFSLKFRIKECMVRWYTHPRRGTGVSLTILTKEKIPYVEAVVL